MGKGISVYIGLPEYSIEDNLKYMAQAKQFGINKVFTSLHIPESDFSKIIGEFKQIASFCKENEMILDSDISPMAFEHLGIDKMDMKSLKEMGVSVLRLDFGYNAEEIATLTRNSDGVKIDLNASTLTLDFLEEFEKFNPDFENMCSTHNYYPRPETGLTKAFFSKRNELIKKYKLQIAAFIPSLIGKRPPIFEGLPTIEEHRYKSPFETARECYMLGADDVFFGDAHASIEELEMFARVEEKVIQIRIEQLVHTEIVDRFLSQERYNNRPDEAMYAIRIEQGRYMVGKGDKILPENCIERSVGAITIDNHLYKRYMGEMQIIFKELPADEKINVAAKILESDVHLIQYLKDRDFKFIKECSCDQ